MIVIALCANMDLAFHGQPAREPRDLVARTKGIPEGTGRLARRTGRCRHDDEAQPSCEQKINKDLRRCRSIAATSLTIMIASRPPRILRPTRPARRSTKRG